jgi:hypothetical protein
MSQILVLEDPVMVLLVEAGLMIYSQQGLESILSFDWWKCISSIPARLDLFWIP